MSFNLVPYRKRLAELAAENVLIGTSSWKYPGWCGQIYTESRYHYRNKFAKTRFEKGCLEEYAQTFSTVCIDAAFYTFPSETYIADLCGAVPAGFRFALKVTDDITLKKFPGIDRFKERAGTFNPAFLSSSLFLDRFLAPLATQREKIGPIIFEFGQFKAHEYEHGSQFVADLDGFLSKLPKGWEFSVEIRNKNWLVPEYFQMLKTHGVAHVYNNWSRMPSIAEQIEMPDSETADFSVSRFLLKPGRTYEQAVSLFQPYERTQEPNEEARSAAKKLVTVALQKRRRCYIYVNNRLEGNAPLMIDSFLEIGAATSSPEPLAPLPKEPGELF